MTLPSPKAALLAQDAILRSATIEIRTLHVGKKQVTLAVFRQIQRESILTEDCTLAGQPWGFINYWPDKETAKDGDLHVLWQKGGELRRDHMRKPGNNPRPDAMRAESELLNCYGQDLATYAYREALEARDWSYAVSTATVRLGSRVYESGGRYNFVNTFREAHDDSRVADSAIYKLGIKRVVGGWEREPTPEELAAEKARLLAEAEESFMNEVDDYTKAELTDLANASLARIVALQQAWQLSYDECLAAGQLYIAL